MRFFVIFLYLGFATCTCRPTFNFSTRVLAETATVSSVIPTLLSYWPSKVSYRMLKSVGTKDDFRHFH